MNQRYAGMNDKNGKFGIIRKNMAVLWTVIFLLLAGCGSANVVNPSEVSSYGTMQQKEAETNESTEKTGGTLQVHYIDVGQGDATLLICDGEAMLIDGGNNDKGTALQSYLNSQNVTSLKYVIGTHPDADHIGGLDVVITKFDCEMVLLPEEEKDTATYRDVIEAIDYRGSKKVTPAVGEVYTLGSAEFTIVGPTEESSDSNDNSIALVLRHGENGFYFEGDSSETAEENIINTGIDLHSNVYMAGHHGSKTSSSDAILAEVEPDYAVISVGEENSYGHPNAEVLNKLRQRGVEVFRTDEQGTIVAKSDGENLTWNTVSSDSWQAGEPMGAESDSTSFSAQTQDNIVHITKSGKKYHSAGCTYLESSDIELDLQKAKERGYTPCSKCNPPQ